MKISLKDKSLTGCLTIGWVDVQKTWCLRYRKTVASLRCPTKSCIYTGSFLEKSWNISANFSKSSNKLKSIGILAIGLDHPTTLPHIGNLPTSGKSTWQLAVTSSILKTCASTWYVALFITNFTIFSGIIGQNKIAKPLHAAECREGTSASALRCPSHLQQTKALKVRKLQLGQILPTCLARSSSAAPEGSGITSISDLCCAWVG